MAVAHLGVVTAIAFGTWRSWRAGVDIRAHGHPEFASRWEEALGFAALFCVVSWLVAGPLWLTINARGLKRRAPWARRSMLVYWTLSPLLCLGFAWYGMFLLIPLCFYGIWSLSRRDTVDLFTKPTSVGLEGQRTRSE